MQTHPDIDDAFARLAASLRIDAATGHTPAVPAMLAHPAQALAAAATPGATAPAAAADRMGCQPLDRTAFSAKVALACEVARLRCTGSSCSMWSGAVEDLAWRAGKLVAEEGADLSSPLVALANAGCDGVARQYELSYWIHTCSNDGSRFFEVAPDGRWVVLMSKGAEGASGSIRLHQSHVQSFFARATDPLVDDYYDVVCNPYPAGGSTLVYRIEDLSHVFDTEDAGQVDSDASAMSSSSLRPAVNNAGMLAIDPDAHLSHGEIVFGHPAQELRQLGALVRLRPLVERLLKCEAPTAEACDAARARASGIASRARIFMPESGICNRCGSDVTTALSITHAEDSITGCPLCGASWCE